MKFFLIFIFIFCFTLVGCNNNSKNIDEKNSNYNVSMTTSNSETNIQNNIPTTNPIIETELASFSTPITNPNDTARVTNISITCSKLNGIIVKSR